jgi:hypothetical protein
VCSCVPQAQSDLILPIPLSLGSLGSVVEEISGFFIIEAHVLDTTGSFRSSRDVEELWEAIVHRLAAAVEAALANESDPDSYLRAKEQIMAFVITLEVWWASLAAEPRLTARSKSYSYSTQSLHAFTLKLFEKYATLLERQFSKRFKDVGGVLGHWQSPMLNSYLQIIANDDLQQMIVQNVPERDAVLKVVWLQKDEQEELAKSALTCCYIRYMYLIVLSRQEPPVVFSWSQGFYLSCEDVRHLLLCRMF